jgi:quinol monooxygenase YgiN
MSNRVGVMAKLIVQDGMMDTALAALAPMLDNVATEEGTEIYILHREEHNDNVLWVYEIYTSQEAFRAHSTSAVMKSLGPVLGDLLATRPELTFLTPIGGKGLPTS